nr:MAG TPA: hypothetical protein [Caudoviricetes sp.]
MKIKNLNTTGYRLQSYIHLQHSDTTRWLMYKVGRIGR